ncbi:MAG: hypothetical protein JSW64_10085 [Candidatus Zixiibacteriota bacterium]|nr:MAG: hypothetical protein JSW64_10085 [candidate division Zixibacteria bacterium]
MRWITIIFFLVMLTSQLIADDSNSGLNEESNQPATTRFPCNYVVGDVSGDGNFNALDVVYGLEYFLGGIPPVYICECTTGDWWYVAGDVNGSCSYNGADITRSVRYFTGGASPQPCADCPPAP